jgi:hypothetical protein
MAGEDCAAGFAIFPIIMIVVFLSILSKALRGAGGYSGGYSSGYRSYRRPGAYYALQYLDNRGGYYGSSYNTGYGQPYQQTRYTSYTPPQQMYREQPPSGIQPSYPAPGAPAYGSAGYQGYQPQPAPAYQGGYNAGGVPAPAYSSQPPQTYAQYPSGPAPDVPKATCSYCGSLSPATERHCMLCGAPMK